MSELTRDEIRALVQKAADLIKQAHHLQKELHLALAERARGDRSGSLPRARQVPERRKAPRGPK